MKKCVKWLDTSINFNLSVLPNGHIPADLPQESSPVLQANDVSNRDVEMTDVSSAVPNNVSNVIHKGHVQQIGTEDHEMSETQINAGQSGHLLDNGKNERDSVDKNLDEKKNSQNGQMDTSLNEHKSNQITSEHPNHKSPINAPPILQGACFKCSFHNKKFFSTCIQYEFLM